MEEQEKEITELHLTEGRGKCSFQLAAETGNEYINGVLNGCLEIFDIIVENDVKFQRLKELVKADADGRCIVLPVKKGEQCFVKRIAEGITIEQGTLVNVAVLVDRENERMLMHLENVFSEKEDAELALEGGALE